MFKYLLVAKTLQKLGRKRVVQQDPCLAELMRRSLVVDLIQLKSSDNTHQIVTTNKNKFNVTLHMNFFTNLLKNMIRVDSQFWKNENFN